MFVVSMDHSPQEIPHERDVWHTSALLLSVDSAQWGWDHVLGPLLNPQGRNLKKWAGGRSVAYRTRFRVHFPQVLRDSDVIAIAFSVQGGTMIDYLEPLVSQMGLANNLLVSDDEVAVVGLKSRRDFVISRNKAAYLVYLFHFICRMHAMIFLSLQEHEQAQYCDWHISPDNFPGGIQGPMSKLFSIMANSATASGFVRGNLRVSTHYLKGDAGTDVCDNLAGMLKDDIAGVVKDGLVPASSRLEYLKRPKAGGLYWEIHSSDEGIDVRKNRTI